MWRVIRYLGLALAALLVLAVVAVGYLQNHVAQTVLAEVLDDLGTDYTGLESIELNLFAGSAAVGPLNIGAEDDPAKIARFEVNVDLLALLEARAQVTDVTVSGVELSLSRQPDGEWIVAGVPLSELVAEGETQDAEPAIDQPGFGLGLDDLVLTDSRVRIEDFTGGRLEVVIDRFELDELDTLETAQDATFALQASLNGIGLTYTGSLKLFSEPKVIDVDGQISGITFERVARFADPTAEEQIDGTIDTAVSHRLTLFEDGRIEGSSTGTVTLDALAIATPVGETLDLSGAGLSIELRHDLDAAANVDVTGELALDLGSAGVVSETGERVALTGARIAGETMNIRILSGEGQQRIRDGLIDRLAEAAGDETPSLIDLLVNVVVALAQEILSRDLEIAGTPSIRVDGVSALVPAEDGGSPLLDASLGEVSVSAPDLDAGRVGRNWELSGGLEVELRRYESATAVRGEILSSSIQGFDVDVGELVATTDPETTKLDLDLALVLSGVSNGASRGQTLNFDRISLGSPGLAIDGRGELTGEASGPLKLAIEGFEGRYPGEPGFLSLSGGALEIDLAEVDIARLETQGASTRGTVSLTGWRFDQEGSPLSASVGEVAIQLPLATVTLDDDGVKVQPGRTERPTARLGADGEFIELPERLGLDAELSLGAEAPTVEVGIDQVAGDRIVPKRRPEPEAFAEITAEAEPAATDGDAGAGPVVPKRRPKGEALDAAIAVLDNAPNSGPMDMAGTMLEPEQPLELPRPDDGFVIDPQPSDAGAGTFGVTISNVAATAPIGDGTASVAGQQTELTLTSFDFASAASSVSLAGGLAFRGWRGEDSGSGIAAAFDSVRMDASLLRVDLAGTPGINGQISAGIDGLTASVPNVLASPIDASLGSIQTSLDEAVLNAESVQFAGEASVADLRLTEVSDAPNTFSVNGVSLEGFSFADGVTVAEALRVVGLDIEVTEKILDVIDAADESQNRKVVKLATAPPALPMAAGAQDLPQIALNRFSISPGSSVTFTDFAAGDLVRLDVAIEQLDFGPLDLRDPQRNSLFEIRLGLNDVASAFVGGSAKPLLSPPEVDIEAGVDNIPLAPLSPYLEDELGHEVKSGVLSTSLSGQIVGGQLDGRLFVDLDDFFFRPVDAAAAAAFKDAFVVSADYAVGLLRDNDGDVDLLFPISGTLDSPAIDFSDLVGKAVGGALVSILPFSWFDDSEWETEEVAVRFAAGSSKLPSGYLGLVDRIGNALKSDADTPVQLCGIGTPADIAAVRDVEAEAAAGPVPTREEIIAATELATAREQTLRDYVETRHGLPADRIGQCQSQYVDDTTLPPRAVFLVIDS